MNIIKLPTWRSYCNYTGSNYGIHCLAFDLGPVTLYYSYKTLVAFETATGCVVLKNYWRSTTGKHLNAIDGGDKKSRVDTETFERLYKEQVEPLLKGKRNVHRASN